MSRAALVAVVASLFVVPSLSAEPPPVMGLHPESMKVGDWGLFAVTGKGVHAGQTGFYPFKIVQVLDAHSALVRPVASDVLFMLKGVSTKGWTDGSETPLEDLFEVTGTTTYDTVSGATRTVFVVEPEPKEHREAHAAVEAKIIEAQAKEAAAKAEAARQRQAMRDRLAEIEQAAQAEAAKERKAQQNEVAAAAKLKLVKMYLNDNNVAKAKQKLQELIQEFPATKVIPKAKELLQQLEDGGR